MGKILLLTLNEQEEKVIDKIIAAISDCILVNAYSYLPPRTLSASSFQIVQMPLSPDSY